jgi:excinuclease ABC subunit A
MAASEIRIESARSHNLQGVSCTIPLGSLTVVSGVSGSGKSTLAFDTLYAEGQRRYVTSLSTYARQFLERLPRPDVDLITNLPPAIAIEQRNRVTNARSTVGTATEILDHLRLLFAKVGETRCCGEPVEPGTVEAVCDRVLARWEGKRVSIGTPLRLLGADGSVLDVTELSPAALNRVRESAVSLVDRLALRSGEGRARLAEAVAVAFHRGGGQLVLVTESGERAVLREGFCCDHCGRRQPTPEPALFSFNSVLGACETCQGFGRVAALDLERVVPDPGRSLEGDAIAPFATPGGRACKRDLLRACRRAGVPRDRPWQRLSARHREWVVEGDGDGWYGVRGFFEYLEKRRYKVQSRVLIARYRRFDPCPDCAGDRLRPEALGVVVGGRHIGELSRETIHDLRLWTESLALSSGQEERAGRLRAALLARLVTADDVGLGYLSLARQMRTLSGGEAQRIQLATALGGTLTAALYVLDEPSVGLHARDVARLLDVLRSIRDQGNTVVVVEHAPEIVAAADHLIDLGPGAGRAGGRLVAEGSVAEVRACAESPTGRALGGETPGVPRRLRSARGALRVVGARENNLRDLSVEIPLGQLVVVSGVSGAGKSTLVRKVLVGGLLREPERGDCERIEGGDQVAEVVVVEPTPPGRSLRSNPATLSKAFDGIRRRFAATHEARARGLTPGWFSFNVPGGRCERCEGTGENVVDMQFLEDVRVPCELCLGARYREEALTVRLGGAGGGRSIVEVLALTIDEALDVFAADAQIAPRLAPFARVGLGYLTLAQPLSTLSGGELQRMRLGLALGEAGRRAGVLYVLDEPTTGLHPAEVQMLVGCLDELLETGASVIVVEHNLDLIRQADFVLDLGPEGGPGGGKLVAAGSPAQVARVKGSWTGAALRGELDPPVEGPTTPSGRAASRRPRKGSSRARR